MISTVAFFVNVFPKLSETFILYQIVGILRMGINIHIYSLNESDEKIVHKDVTTYKLMDKVTYLRGLRPDELSIISFDVIHCHFGTSAVTACRLREFGIIEGKLLTSFHGFDVNVRKYNSAFYSGLIKEGDYYTANTEYTLQRAVSLGFSKEKISIIHEGVNMDLFDSDHKVSFNDGKIRILTVGRLVEKKGIVYVIDAMEIIKGNYSKAFTLDIIGDGPLFEQLNTHIHQRGLNDVVKLHGAKNSNEVFKFFQGADIFVLPSIDAENGDSEGQGLVLQEAQAMEIPVVSTFHNGIPEGVRNNVTGFLVEQRNPRQLADKIWQLISNLNLRLQMGKEGKAFVKERFDVNVLNKKLVDIYSNLTATN